MLIFVEEIEQVESVLWHTRAIVGTQGTGQGFNPHLTDEVDDVITVGRICTGFDVDQQLQSTGRFFSLPRCRKRLTIDQLRLIATAKVFVTGVDELVRKGG